jgi:ABC-type nitrate/sulfonate/bicarbonate transport system substrate-binding protein
MNCLKSSNRASFARVAHGSLNAPIIALPHSSSLPSPGRRSPLRIGFIALTDAAPLIVADDQGLFAKRGLRVELSREIGWATIRDKIIYGELDAAQAPAPLLWSAQLGIGCPPCEVLTAFVLSRHGNGITLSQALWQAGVRDDAALRKLARERRARNPLTFGAVFPFSSHHLLLRQWLHGAGIDPDRDVRIVIVPPAQVFRNLAAGTIDGFCAGEPWNSIAVQQGRGWCRLVSATVTPGHVEKVLMVRQAFAQQQPTEHGQLLSALAESCAWCDLPANRAELASLLSARAYVNVSAAALAPSLGGPFDFGHGRREAIPDFHVFHHADANLPDPQQAEALQRALCAAGLVPPEAVKPQLPHRLFRHDLYRSLLTAMRQPLDAASTPSTQAAPQTSSV